jgi:uncharacterized membrane protein
MVDRRGLARLALEALAELGIGGAARGDQLDRDRAVEPQVRCEVDDTHAAAPRDSHDAAAGELAAGGEVVHAPDCDGCGVRIAALSSLR